MTAQVSAAQSDKRIGLFAHELCNLHGTASLAFAAAKIGNLSFSGATGAMLERTLMSLEKLIASSLEDARMVSNAQKNLAAFSLANFVSELYSACALSAEMHNCTLRASPVDAELALVGDRDLLLAAVANLLQNAFKFTHSGTEILLTAYAAPLCQYN